VTTDPYTADLLAQMWERFRPLAHERLALLDEATAAAEAGTLTPELRERGASAAHKLAGSLGSFGREGSDEAKRAELLLAGPADPAALRALVDALRSRMA
jgi:HPt (histidine-containing phosphotransfer) domain-containing protein